MLLETCKNFGVCAITWSVVKDGLKMPKWDLWYVCKDSVAIVHAQLMKEQESKFNESGIFHHTIFFFLNKL